MPLIPDTLTEIYLVLESPGFKTSGYNSEKLPLVGDIPAGVRNRFLIVASALKVKTQEDPLRVKYPLLFRDATLPEVLLDDGYTEETFNESASRVKRAGQSQPYIYKRVDRPFYEPNDTNVFLNELRNLKLLRGKPYIVQLCSIVVSNNPYQTTPTCDNALVIRGFLLEYHPLGDLEHHLQKAD